MQRKEEVATREEPQPLRQEEDETEIEEDDGEDEEKKKAEEERKEKERLEEEKKEKERLEEERKEKERQEEEERKEKERLEEERKEKERLEEERKEKERLEEERKEKERLEEERKEKERLEEERKEKERLEEERKEKERLEEERKEKERLEEERKEKERLEEERKEKERLEEERKEKERLEEERKQKERLEQERREKERLEEEAKKRKERLEELKKEQEQLEKEKQEAEENKQQKKEEKGEKSAEDEPVQDQVVADLGNWARDESQPVDDSGFRSFLTGRKEPSSAEGAETGKQPVGSPDQSGSLGQAGSPGDDVNTGKPAEISPSASEASYSTVIEAGTTFLMDRGGNLVTAFSLQDSATKPSVEPTRVDNSAEATAAQASGNSVNGSVLPDTPAPSLDGSPVAADIYQNADFNSRKVLSVNKPSAQPAGGDTTPQPPLESSSAGDPWAGQKTVDPLGGESATQSYFQYPTTPSPPSEVKEADENVQADTASVDDQQNKVEEEKSQPEVEITSPGFAKSVLSGVDEYISVIISALPASLRDVLNSQPLGLTPQMAVLVILAALLMLVSLTLTSCGGQAGEKLRAPLEVIGELEAKLQLTEKEKENLEDQVAEAVEERDRRREEAQEKSKEADKLREESEKNQEKREELEERVAELVTEVSAQVELC